MDCACGGTRAERQRDKPLCVFIVSEECTRSYLCVLSFLITSLFIKMWKTCLSFAVPRDDPLGVDSQHPLHAHDSERLGDVCDCHSLDPHHRFILSHPLQHPQAFFLYLLALDGRREPILCFIVGFSPDEKLSQNPLMLVSSDEHEHDHFTFLCVDLNY